MNVVISDDVIESAAGYLPFLPPNSILKPAFLYSLSRTQAIAIKWGNCQKNWIAKRVPPYNSKSSVAATQPSKKGMAPGIAPIKTDVVEIRFRGV